MPRIAYQNDGVVVEADTATSILLASLQNGIPLGQHRDLAIKGKTGTYSLHEVVGLAAPEGDGHPEAAPSHVA